MLKYSDISKEQKTLDKIQSGLVVDAHDGQVTLVDGLKELTMYYSAWKYVEIGVTVLDYRQFVHSGGSVGFTVLGLADDETAQAVRETVQTAH